MNAPRDGRRGHDARTADSEFENREICMSSHDTNDDTGLPGSPKTGLPCSVPNASGFPGRCRTFQKCISIPMSSRTRFT